MKKRKREHNAGGPGRHRVSLPLWGAAAERGGQVVTRAATEEGPRGGAAALAWLGS